MRTAHILAPVLGLVLSGCTFDVTVHDEDRAAELSLLFLSQVLFQEEMRIAYDGTHSKFRKAVTYSDFEGLILGIRELTQGATTEILGYETFGTKEAIVVYAHSYGDGFRLFYKLTYLGTKSTGYALAGFHVNNKAFPRKGIYKDYRYVVRVGDV